MKRDMGDWAAIIITWTIVGSFAIGVFSCTILSVHREWAAELRAEEKHP